MKRPMDRRGVLRVLAGAVAILPATRGLWAQDKGGGAANGTVPQPSWSFEGVTGPQHWPELSPDYSLCEFGLEQSPVDLVDALKVSGTQALELDYRPVTAHVIRDSWTLRVVFAKGSGIAVNGAAYRLDHMLMRRPSEHMLSGRALEMELQLVHRKESGDLAVIAVFVRQGRDNEVLETVLTHLPEESASKGQVFPINPSDLLPILPEWQTSRTFYRYMGSITTPPCTEGVVWTVFKAPVEASPRQIRELAKLFPANARPASPINRRYLLEYGG